MENGVAVVDFGASTVNISVFEESDPKYVSVIPMGSNNITNDLAMELKIETEVAEELKVKYVDVNKTEDLPDIKFSKGKEHFIFPRGEVDEIVDARLDEIFDAIRKEFKKAGYDRRLPEGIVLVGDGARLKNLKGYAKDKLEVSTRIGTAENIAGGGCVDKKPEYATSVGLMIIAAQAEAGKETEVVKTNDKDGKMEGFFKRLIGKFRD
jgi:cell division protein FtsA